MYSIGVLYRGGLVGVGVNYRSEMSFGIENDLLDRLAASGGMTLTQIATDLDQSPATAYRVLTTLETRGIEPRRTLRGSAPSSVATGSSLAPTSFA